MPEFVLIKEGPRGKEELKSIGIDSFLSAIKALGVFVPSTALPYELGKWSDAETRVIYYVKPKN